MLLTLKRWFRKLFRIRPKTYLAGPIGVTLQSGAKEWRAFITEELKKIEVGTLNPFGQTGGDRIGKRRKTLLRWMKNGKIEAVRKFSSEIIIPPDIEMVKDCSFVTLWVPIDNGYEICGSYGEITLAFFLKKPVFIVTNRKLKPIELPAWAVGCSTRVFTSWFEYLKFVKANRDKL